MSNPGREPTDRRRWLRWLIVPVMLAAPLLVFWGLADWSSRREVARVRALLAPHSGSSDALMPAPPEGLDAARRLSTIVAPLGLGSDGGRGVGKDEPLYKARELARRAARDELARSSAVPAPAEADVLAAAELMAPALDEARALVLAGPPPRWESLRGGTTWYEPDAFNKLALIDLLLGDAFLRQLSGDMTTALADMEAAWILAMAMREGRSFFSALMARAAVEHVAVAARKIEVPPEEWSARFDAEPLRRDLLADLRVECGAYLEAAQEADVAGLLAERNGESPAWAERVGFVVAPTLRKRLARQAEVNIPILERLEDPARCGPSTHPDPASESAGDSGWGGDWLGGVTGYSAVPSMLDRTRVQLELTRRLLELRARRDADPARRWPEDLDDDGGSSCPGVRFRLGVRGPELLVLEAESQEGPWWEGENGKGRVARVEIWRDTEP